MSPIASVYFIRVSDRIGCFQNMVCIQIDIIQRLYLIPDLLFIISDKRNLLGSRRVKIKPTY